MITNFLHYGFEVDDLDEAIKLYQDLGFKLVDKYEKQEPKAVFAQMESKNQTGLELWQFIDTNHSQVEFIRKHIAVESDDLEADVKKLEQQGCEVVIPATEGITLTYVFIKDPSGNFIEIGKKR